MVPLIFASIDEENVIQRITGNQEVKQHLQDLGFVVGEKVKIINSINGNLIVSVKNVRIAVSKELAKKVMI